MAKRSWLFRAKALSLQRLGSLLKLEDNSGSPLKAVKIGPKGRPPKGALWEDLLSAFERGGLPCVGFFWSLRLTKKTNKKAEGGFGR